MKKKQYISPSVIAVEFKIERGYAISLLRITMDEQALGDFNDYGQKTGTKTRTATSLEAGKT
jgi:hypothetical protein